MNCKYIEKDNYYLDKNNVRFNFLRYSTRHGYGVERNFKIYIVEKYDENHNVITEALTPKGNVRQISINPEWEYYKNKIKSKFSSPKGMAIYHQREFDVESVFGILETNLHFNRFTVRKL